MGDDVVLFSPLSRTSIMLIAGSLITTFINVALSKGFHVFVCRSVLARIVFSGYKKHFGARPLRRSVEKLLVDQLSELLLSGVVENENMVIFSCNAFGRIVFYIR